MDQPFKRKCHYAINIPPDLVADTSHFSTIHREKAKIDWAKPPKLSTDVKPDNPRACLGRGRRFVAVEVLRAV